MFIGSVISSVNFWNSILKQFSGFRLLEKEYRCMILNGVVFLLKCSMSMSHR